MAKEKKTKKAKPVAQRKSKVIVKKKKKRWFGIVSPKEFGARTIGETLAEEPNNLVGRVLKVNLMNLTNDFKRQGVNVKFRIESVNDNNAICKTIGCEIVKSHSRRMVRKGTDKMDDSFIVEAKDNVKLKIKPIIVTRHRVSLPVISDIRKKSREFISEKVKELNSIEVFESVVQSKMQKDLRISLLKVCPVGGCDIRSVSIVK